MCGSLGRRGEDCTHPIPLPLYCEWAIGAVLRLIRPYVCIAAEMSGTVPYRRHVGIGEVIFGVDRGRVRGASTRVSV